MSALRDHLRSLETRVAPRGIASLLVTAFAVSVCLVLFRLPFILFQHELNGDESQMLSQAMKFMTDPVPWRAVDGTSGGPLNSYLISIFLFVGLKPSYALAHILATALVSLQVIVAHQTLVRLVSRNAAAWGILPMIFCYSFSRRLDYYFYASELLPSLMLALGFHGFVVSLEKVPERPPLRHLVLLFLTGLALGSAPWCKSQAFPMVAAVGAVALAATVLYEDRSSYAPPRWTQATAFSAGVVFPGSLILGVVAQAGVMRDFWYSYVLGNIAYAGKLSWTAVFGNFISTFSEFGILPLLIGGVLATVLSIAQTCVKRGPSFSSKDRLAFMGLLLLFGATLFAICRPAAFGPHYHYTILLVYPMTCLVAVLLSKGLSMFSNKFLVALEVAAKVVVVLTVANFAAPLMYRIVVLRTQPPSEDTNQKIAAVVAKMGTVHPVRSMAIWGWAPGAYVVTGIPPATRDAIGHFVITPGPLQRYFRHRFVGDLRQKMPDLFVDAVARGAFIWSWSERDGYESDDELRDFIDRNYALVEQLTLTEGAKPVRFFARRDMLAGSQYTLRGRLPDGATRAPEHRQPSGTL